MEIKILTDTSAEFTIQERKQFGLINIDMPITIEDQEYIDVDAKILWKELLSGKRATTSQPSQQQIRDEFEKAKNEGYALVCVLLSSALSGTYENAVAIKNQVGYENIYIVDSLNATMAEHLIVEEAIKLKDAGLSASEIFEKLENFKKRIKLFACIDSLKFLALGGRISKAAATVGNVLNIKPVIKVNELGEVQVVVKKIGIIKSLKEIMTMIEDDKIDTSYPVITIYAYDNKNALKLIETLETKNLPVTIKEPREIGHVIGTHIGPGGCGVIYVEKE